MNNKTITIKDNGTDKNFSINKLFASDALKFVNIITDINVNDNESVQSTKRFIDFVIENGQLPNDCPSEYNFIDVLLQLVKKKYTQDESFIEILLNNTVFINGQIKIGNITLINDKTEANNINNIITSIPGFYKLIREHLIFNYNDFFLIPEKG